MKCVPGDDCEVTGVVDDRDFLVSVSRVRLIDTNVEPSAAAIKDAACWLCSLNCSDDNGAFYVDYVDVVIIRKILAGEKYVWHLKFFVYGVENFVHKKIGPGEVYLVKRQGAWHYFKTKP